MKIGDQVGRWTLVDQAESKFYFDKHAGTPREHPHWFCRCQCGVAKVVSAIQLRQKRSLSCGCLNRELSSLANTKHGESKNYSSTPEHLAWKSMRVRCSDPKNPSYHNYGGRGIKVCKRWDSFENFLSDLGRRPTKDHSLDRKKNHLGYSPRNCRWALPHEQMVNRRNTFMVEVLGEKIPLASLAKEYSISQGVLRYRVLEGWPLLDALTLPVRKKRSKRLKLNHTYRSSIK